MVQTTTLEESLAKIVADHDLSKVSISLMMVGERKVWCALVHWDRHNKCVDSMVDTSCVDALSKALDEAAVRRRGGPVDALPALEIAA